MVTSCETEGWAQKLELFFFKEPKATCIENIDIGGPAMIRASAKNNAAVSGS